MLLFCSFAISLEYQPAPVTASTKKLNITPAGLGKVSKRALARSIDGCPVERDSEYTVFAGSLCHEENFAGPYFLTCQNPTPNLYAPYHVYDDACRPHEICFNRHAENEEGNWPVWKAWCISGEAIVNLAQARLADIQRRVTIFPQGSGFNQMEMVLTGYNSDNVLFKATEIIVVAKDEQNNALGKGISCAECSHLSFVNWPAGTTSFDATIDLPHVNDIAVLHVMGWPPS